MRRGAKYRRDIQVLRGLAVIAVVFYHANENYFPLGYLGVDVFFVISGFVVTPLILEIFSVKNFQGRIFNLREFYRRRFYRLAPALAFMLVASAVAILLLGDPSDHKRFARQGIATILLVGNFGAYKYSGDYFSPNPNPLIHTWSLSIEEQIYIFLPILLLLILHNRKQYRVITVFVFLLVTLVSFVLFFFPTILQPLYYQLDIQISSLVNFYSPITRTWQFTTGGLAYFLASKYKDSNLKSFKSVNLFFAVGLLVLLFSSIPINLNNSSLIATVLSFLIILLRTLDFLPDYFCSKFEWLGDRSYSIYLLHMPILYIAKFSPATTINGGQNRFIQTIIATFVSILLGSLSFSRIENKFRDRGKVNAKKLKTNSFVVVTLLTPFIFFAIIDNGIQHKYWGLYKNIQPPVRIGDNGSNCFGRSEVEPQCIYNQNQSKKKVLLIGDSHAVHFSDAVATAAKNTNWTAIVWTQSGCIVQFEKTTGSEIPEDCLALNNKMLDWVKKNKPDLIILSQYIHSDSSQRDLQNALLQLKALVPNILLVENNPIFQDDPFNLPILFQILRIIPFKEVPLSRMNYEDKKSSDELVQFAQNHNISTLSLWPNFCDKSSCVRYSEAGWLYTDDHHLSVAGAALAIPQFESFLNRF